MPNDNCELTELTGRVAYLEGRVMEMSRYLQAVSEQALKTFDALQKLEKKIPASA